MATQNPNTAKASKPQSAPVIKSLKPLLERQNIMIIGGGILLLIIGYMLMTGGQQKPTEWNKDEIYSFRRITVAPIVVVLGYIVVGFGLMTKPKETQTK